MSMFVPVLLVGALASTALAMENPANAAAATPVTGNAPKIVPMDAGAETPGVGAYLIGAVADLRGSPTIALKGYMRALSEDPDNMELRQRTFELALMDGDMDNAVRLARSIPAEEQSTMTRLVRMADDAHTGKVDAARKESHEVSKVAGELLQFRLFQAYLDYAHGTKPEELVRWLNSTPMPDSMGGRLAYHEARIWLKAGDMNKALALLEKAHKIEPGNVATTQLLGDVLARQGQPDKAAVLYDTFRAENPAVALLMPDGRDIMNRMPEPFASTLDDDLASVLSDFGLLVWAQGALGPARQVLNVSLWLNPDDYNTRYYTGLLLEMGNDTGAAKDQYALLTKDNVPDNIRIAAQIRLAEIAYREGDKDIAWDDLRELAKQNPNLPGLQRSVAQLAFNKGEYTQAIDSYSALLGTLPEGTPAVARAELLFARGAAYERSGNIKAATEDMQAALKLTPAEPQIMNYLGYMWVDKGVNIEQAFELLQKAHLLAPEDGAITDSLGWAYYKQGDYATAMTYLVLATEQDPESPEIFDHLGDAYAKLGRTEDARREWQRALDLVAVGKEGPSKDFTKSVTRKLR